MFLNSLLTLRLPHCINDLVSGKQYSAYGHLWKSFSSTKHQVTIITQHKFVYRYIDKLFPLENSEKYNLLEHRERSHQFTTTIWGNNMG